MLKIKINDNYENLYRTSTNKTNVLQREKKLQLQKSVSYQFFFLKSAEVVGEVEEEETEVGLVIAHRRNHFSLALA